MLTHAPRSNDIRHGSRAANRKQFRAYPLDGAMLHFHPGTGASLRIENASTAPSRRQAPRVVMFGITNKCNLQCSFCSRDSSRPSLWTVETASAMLKGLSQAGTLEVAFGGGEPLAFRGFSELITELHAATPLALNVTTNGTAPFHPILAKCAGLLGQVRLSIYEDIPWRDTARLLSDLGQRWGANLLISPAALRRLPERLMELALLGCHDVSLLSYVGNDTSLHLDDASRARLADIITEAPLTIRVSVCFGERLGLPRLFAGADDSGDCGAGLDFITITPDGYVQSCSFQDQRFPARTAQDVLQAWRAQRDALSLSSPRLGCHRQQGGARQAVSGDHAPIMLWQAFSGNNSGECVMVARFETPRDAQAYLDRLLPAYQPGEQWPAEWLDLLHEERILTPHDMEWAEMPDELLAVGRTVMATGYCADDAFEPLRALAWKRDAYLPLAGVHRHEPAGLLAAIRADNRAHARALLDTLSHPAAAFHLDDERILIRFALEQGKDQVSLTQACDLLKQWAGERPLAAELLENWPDEDGFTRILQQRGKKIAQEPRMAVYFYSYAKKNEENLNRFVGMLDEEQVDVVGGTALISRMGRKRKRLAVLAYRHEGHVCALDGCRLEINGWFWPLDKLPKNGEWEADARQALRLALREALPGIEIEKWHSAEKIRLETQDPHAVLPVLQRIAHAQRMRLNLSLRDMDDVALAMRRVLADVMR